MAKTDDEKDIEEGMQSDPLISANREEAEEAEEFARWANSPMGRKVIAPIRKDVASLLKQLFDDAADEPTLPQLLTTIAQLDAKLKVLKQFSGARDNAKMLMGILDENESEYRARRAP